MVRSYEDVEDSNRHNETKLILLQFLHENQDHYMRPDEIAEKTGFSVSNVYAQMTKLTKQKYIFRRNIRKKYYYRHLRPKGLRVLKELWIRKQINEKLCIRTKISLIRPEEFMKFDKVYNEIFAR